MPRPKLSLEIIKRDYHPNWDSKKIFQKLPKSEYWTTAEVSEVFHVSIVALCRACRRYKIAKKYRTVAGRGGSYLFVAKDIEDLCYILKGRERANDGPYPNSRKKH